MTARDKVFIHNGHILSYREAEVLLCCANGQTICQTAEQLFISINTVKRHHTNIRCRFELCGMHSLLKLALELEHQLKNWLHSEPKT